MMYYHLSELKCLGENGSDNANQICEDCSIPLLAVIICKACSTSCHEGHRFSIAPFSTICRCFHTLPQNTRAARNALTLKDATGTLLTPSPKHQGKVERVLSMPGTYSKSFHPNIFLSVSKNQFI